ncbi:hypothetical protein DIPPA_06713 [Diplonema papillatum]|nr:hypothetical protein DIPPA_06713 [Diplonema papillatum]
MGGEEQRKDVDGNYYTKAQFIEQYGGTDQWDAKETRCSPANGMYYPKEKFIAFFGGTKEWNRARPNSSSGAAPFNPLGAKRRGRGGGFASA